MITDQDKQRKQERKKPKGWMGAAFECIAYALDPKQTKERGKETARQTRKRESGRDETGQQNLK